MDNKEFKFRIILSVLLFACSSFLLINEFILKANTGHFRYDAITVEIIGMICSILFFISTSIQGKRGDS